MVSAKIPAKVKNLSGSTGFISSPNAFNEQYAPHLNYTWYIEGTRDTRLLLYFTTIDIENQASAYWCTPSCLLCDQHKFHQLVFCLSVFSIPLTAGNSVIILHHGSNKLKVYLRKLFVSHN